MKQLMERPVPERADISLDANPDQDLPIAFLHIPKTAGTSLITALKSLIGGDRLVRLSTIDESTPAQIDRLLADRTRPIGCIAGHYPFHMLAGSLTRCRPFTVLRHPVSRIMSLFRFVGRQPAHELHRLGLRPGFDFTEFVTSRHPELFGQIHNGMTRMLSGLPEMTTAHTPLFWNTEPSAETVEAALFNLERFAFGLVEDMRTTLRVACAAWKVPYEIELGRENVTNATDQQPDTARSLRVILCNPMDLTLYHRAAAMLDARRTWLPPDASATGKGGVLQVPASGQDIAIGMMPGVQGCHETDSSGLAWLTADRLACVRFTFGGSAVRFRLRGYAVTDTYPLDETEVTLDGMRLATTVMRAPDRWFTIEAGPAAVRQPFSVLAVRPPYFLPVRHLYPSAEDRRCLSIALARIGFEPA